MRNEALLSMGGLHDQSGRRRGRLLAATGLAATLAMAAAVAGRRAGLLQPAPPDEPPIPVSWGRSLRSPAGELDGRGAGLSGGDRLTGEHDTRTAG